MNIKEVDKIDPQTMESGVIYRERGLSKFAFCYDDNKLFYLNDREVFQNGNSDENDTSTA